ncbi:protein of unknown function [Acidithiobacillus ferrivorans]|uniref:Uncharacterized protein n=1 Tax=Acidithiobacillus ferrivorans TaxID=160808 RepID=A0A060URM8_9PROT|nr:hypothetical protein AFERRI_50025 [Acidithiobacillus ferrivorans]SMH64996.1 protein of unknown function [Acidithiobacillus ferrivorans]
MPPSRAPCLPALLWRTPPDVRCPDNLAEEPRERAVLHFTAVERYAARYNALHHRQLELSVFNPAHQDIFGVICA